MQQASLVNNHFSVLENGLDLKLESEFLEHAEADTLLKNLIETTPWQQPKLKVYGKWHPTPRLVSFYGEQNLNYKYAKTLHQTLPWTPTLLDLKNRVEQQTQVEFNSVLLNYYRDGKDTMGWHADDEPELGKQPVIASLNLGAQRDIFFKPKNDQCRPLSLTLTSGSMLLMQGDTQKKWLHHIPKRLRCVTPRINLTFRKILR